MTEKNPYENGVNIPDFVNESNDNDVDLSVFKMSEEERDMDEEYADEEPKRKLSAKGLMIIEAAIIVVLLLVAIGGWVFGISKSNAVKKVQSEVATINSQLTAANNEVSTLKAQNVALQQQITDLQKDKTTTTTDPKADKTMTMTRTVAVRMSPSAVKSSFVNFDNLPDDVQEMCIYDKESGRVDISQNSKINVYKTEKDTAGNTWAQIVYNKDVWVCINYGGEDWAK